MVSRVTDEGHGVAGDGHQLGHDVHEDGEGEHHRHACNSAMHYMGGCFYQTTFLPTFDAH